LTLARAFRPATAGRLSLTSPATGNITTT